jgi:hypothetical protein
MYTVGFDFEKLIHNLIRYGDFYKRTYKHFQKKSVTVFTFSLLK